MGEIEGSKDKMHVTQMLLLKAASLTELNKRGKLCGISLFGSFTAGTTGQNMYGLVKISSFMTRGSSDYFLLLTTYIYK